GGGEWEQRRLAAQRRASRAALRSRANHLSTKSKRHTALCEIVDHVRRERLYCRLQAPLSELSARNDGGSTVLRRAVRSVSCARLSRGQRTVWTRRSRRNPARGGAMAE